MSAELKQREQELEAQSLRINAGRKTKFGDLMRNPWAGENNPQRDGYFVREGRRTGRMNPGHWYEFTDRKGKFWEISAKYAFFIEATQPAPIPVQAGGEESDALENEIFSTIMMFRRAGEGTPFAAETAQRCARVIAGRVGKRIAAIKAGGQGGEDGARLDWMAVNEAWIAWNCESTRCRVFHQAEDGELRPIMGYSDKAWASSPREAIDAARATHAKANDGEGVA